MNVFINIIRERFVGIIRKPVSVLGDLTYNKKWQGALTFLLLSMFILKFFTASTILKLQFENNPDLPANFLSETGFASMFIMGIMAAFFYLFVFISVSFFIYLFYSIFGLEGVFFNYFSLVVNISLVVVVIPELVRAIYMLLTGSTINIFNLGALVNNSEKLSWLYLILLKIDIFEIWFIFLVAYGVYGFYKNNEDEFEETKFTLKKSFAIAVFYFIFKSVTIILFSYLFAKLSIILQQMLSNG
jgi:hypothetical protein